MNEIISVDKKTLGKKGEQIAVNFLKTKGYFIQETNYRFGHGEIDIIAKDKNYICFIEVKTLLKKEHFHPLYAITESKKKQLSKLALLYIKKFNLHNKNARFDVVSVIFDSDKSYKVDVIKNAFDLYYLYR